uniref:serine/threonine-protein kinase n=1 Tax=Ornithobacterium rhinotracheale TaxID=28251 RepID=UPI0039A72018
MISQEEFRNRFHYKIRTDKLGGGAFGTVYRAYDNARDIFVAIKVSEVKTIGEKEFSLMEEFHAIQGLPLHPNIAVYEELFTFEEQNGIFDYAIIQYYPIGNLSQLIKEQKLNNKQKEILALQIMDGIEFLHQNNIVHRDLKPSNILIAKREINDSYIPKIADFGLSKKANSNDRSRFTNSFGGGTYEYSSPEQLKGEPLSYNTDWWAYGAIVYEIFTGNALFNFKNESTGTASEIAQVLNSILNSDLKDKIAELPDKWQRIVKKCLDRNPKTRLKDKAEALSLLDESSEVDKTIVLPNAEKTQIDNSQNKAITNESSKKLETKINIENRNPNKEYESKKKEPNYSYILITFFIFCILFFSILKLTKSKKADTNMNDEAVPEAVTYQQVIADAQAELDAAQVANDEAAISAAQVKLDVALAEAKAAEQANELEAAQAELEAAKQANDKAAISAAQTKYNAIQEEINNPNRIKNNISTFWEEINDTNNK